MKKLNITYTQDWCKFTASGTLELGYYPFMKSFFAYGKTPREAEQVLLAQVKAWKTREDLLPLNKTVTI